MSDKVRLGPFRVKVPSRDELPLPGFRPPWAELSGWGRVRRVVFWVSMLGNVGLIVSAETSGSDLRIKSDGTKRSKDDREPDVQGVPPQREQAGEEQASEKRDEPEKQEGKATDSADASA